MKLASTVFLLFLSILSNAQYDYNNIVELTYDFGISNDFADDAFYNSNTSSELILVEKRSSIRTRNIGFGYTRLLNRKNGIKASFAVAKFGFHIKGSTDQTNTNFNNSYTISFLEWGLSYVRCFPLSHSRKIIVEPGLRYHSDGSPRSNGISITRKDSYSFSLYSGYELPMAGNNYFVNVGLQIKIPLEVYNINLSLNEPKDFLPYFIGFKIGVNFQFEPF